MRLKLTLHPDGNENLLPINYQYSISSWIYHRLSEADSEFADWLHSSGYQMENKRFKLFTFSRLHIPRCKARGDRLQILSSIADLIVSFYLDKAAENFVIGLFQHQQLEIADRKSKVCFVVGTVESLPLPQFMGEATFRCISPLCLSKTIMMKGKKSAYYLSPDDTEYSKYFFDNLISKYKAVEASNPNPAKNESSFSTEDFRFNMRSKPKSALQKIKADTPQQTMVRGYLFEFDLTAPPLLLQFGYEAGFGEKNSQGFGCCEVI